MGCDNESAIWKAFGTTAITTGDSAFDILRVIHHQLEISPVTWRYRHVKGHQDDEEGITLDEWARANILADARAEAYWGRKYGDGSRARPQPPIMQDEGWRVSMDGKTVTTDVEGKIHKQAYRKMTAAYWEKKRQITEGSFEKIEWRRYKGAIQSLPLGKRQWVHKHHCGFEGNNYMLCK